MSTQPYTLPRLTCRRCGYTWIPRSERPPETCANPACRTPYWTRERERTSNVVNAKKTLPNNAI